MGQIRGKGDEEARDRALRGMLPAIGAEARRLLVQTLSRSNGVISEDSIESISRLESKPVTTLMVELLPLAASLANPPVSNFHVGALVRGASGRLYFGANIEFPGQSLGMTIHAEQSAAANAYMHRERQVTELAVTAAPCGMCRQFLWEMCYGTGLQILTGKKSATQLGTLLPDAFGPADLGFRNGALPVTDRHLRLRIPKPNETAAAALRAAEMSYAPYSKAYAGVAVRTSSQKVYVGSYIENAAYNPSLSPLQVALAQLSLAGESSAVVEVVLVEVTGKRISHRPATKILLSTFAPSASLRTVVAEP